MHGPYKRLDPGAYRLEIRMQGDWLTAAAARVWIEVCYGDAVVASLRLGADDRRKAIHSLSFDWPASQARLLREPRFEFRVCSDGVADLEIRGLTLERLGPPSGNPTIIDWLPMLQAGGAGSITAEGIVTSASTTGHVFFGPYRAVLPEMYVLTVECEVTTVPRGSSHVIMEVLTQAGELVAKRRFELSNGSARLEMIFEPPTIQRGDLVSPPLEFRLSKPAHSAFTVRNVLISALEEGSTKLC